MMNGMQNHMRIEAQRVLGEQAKPRIGIVDGYDPSHYAVKVRIQPENELTGWMPLTTPWVGNLWGMYAAPSLGDIVEVHFQQNSPNAGFVVQRFFSSSVQPLAVPSGQFWLVDKTGSYIKLTADGNVLSKGTWNHVGNLNVTGNIYATADITDQTLTTNETIRSMREIYDIHVHEPSNIPPTPQM